MFKSALAIWCFVLASVLQADTIAFTNFRNAGVPPNICGVCEGINAAGFSISAINSRGDVTGFYVGNMSGTGFLVKNGDVISSGFPDGGSRGTFPTGINDSDLIVGYYYGVGNQSGGSHAFIRTPEGTFMSFDFSATASYTTATAVNNAGIIAGDYGNSATDSTHAFVRVDGTNYGYDPEGATNSYALRMTNANELWGSYYLPGDGSNARFFLLDVTTVPEPETLPACGFLLAAALGWAIRKRIGPRGE